MPDPETQPSLQLPSIRVFFSYVRADDANFNFIEPLRTMLKQLMSGLSGRPVEVFVDRHDISLGENWREKIENAVRQSYFFSSDLYCKLHSEQRLSRRVFSISRGGR